MHVTIRNSLSLSVHFSHFADLVVPALQRPITTDARRLCWGTTQVSCILPLCLDAPAD